MPPHPRQIIVLLLAVWFVVLPAAWAAPPARVVYTVSASDIPNKTYHVAVRAEGLSAPTIAFAIPAWTPGYYVLTNFYKNIRDVSAAGSDGAPRKVTPRDAQTWQVETNGARSITLRYAVRAVDRNYGFFHTYLDERNGFINGPAALMYVVDGKTAPCRIEYRLPTGWKVASANTTTDDPFAFTAPDYDTLADQPADLGHFARHDRTIQGVPVSVVLVGAEDRETTRFVENVFTISAAGIRLFGGAPFPRYLFHFHIRSGRGAAGLEHLNSTVISLGENLLRAPSPPPIIAHEFVHAWNIKRVRPQLLGPFDYSREVRVKDLWWAEGVTEYYTPRLMAEAGLADRGYLYRYFAGAITQLQNNPARRRVTLEEASIKAWEGGSEGFGGLSYYNKGQVVGLLLDIEMRRRTRNRVGLDDLMKRLLRDAERTGRGFDEGGIEAAAAELTGTDLAPFFARALRSTEELPIRETLAQAGLSLSETVTAFPFLGVTWDRAGDGGRAPGGRIRSVLPESAAERAGLKAGDIITHVDGKPATSLADRFRNNRPGDRVRLTFVREKAQPRSVLVTLGKREQRAYRISEKRDLTPLQSAILAAITRQAAPNSTTARR